MPVSRESKIAASTGNGPHRGSIVGKLIRIYKNADKKVIGFDTVHLVCEVQKISQNKFHCRAERKVQRDLVHHTGETRVISYITVMGDYSEIEDDFSAASWPAQNEYLNDIFVDMSDLPSVGDSI
ncbi:hypothetical protein GF373_17505 [bacterium]|nr:hypothetical protein [bacterium]